MIKTLLGTSGFNNASFSSLLKIKNPIMLASRIIIAGEKCNRDFISNLFLFELTAFAYEYIAGL
jgi:hypothetical protein